MDTRDTNQMSQSPSLCRSGCGFYGNPSNDGLCSKCYKDAVKRKQSAPSPQMSSPQMSQSSAPLMTSSMTHSGAIGAGRTSPQSPPLSETSSNLPLLATFENSLNTASPTVPSAIIASAQDLITKGLAKGLEGLENQESSQSSAVNNTSTAATIDSTAGTTQTTPQIETNLSDPPKTQKKKKNRCTKCKVNVGVIGFPCRCGGTFCSSHRYANEHNCTFDYKEHGAEEIRKNNPQVIGEKVTKI